MWLKRRAARRVEATGRAQASADQIWDVLADPYSYAHWVCGTVRIRAADETWPEPGSRLWHVFGAGPLRVRDYTTVLAAERPHRLVLQARARPFGAVLAELEIVDDGDETEIVLRQQMRGGLAAVFAYAGHAVQLRRNRRSLANLIAFCAPGTAVPTRIERGSGLSTPPDNCVN